MLSASAVCGWSDHWHRNAFKAPREALITAPNMSSACPLECSGLVVTNTGFLWHGRPSTQDAEPWNDPDPTVTVDVLSSLWPRPNSDSGCALFFRTPTQQWQWMCSLLYDPDPTVTVDVLSSLWPRPNSDSGCALFFRTPTQQWQWMCSLLYDPDPTVTADVLSSLGPRPNSDGGCALFFMTPTQQWQWMCSLL